MIRPSAGTITSPYGWRVHPITGKRTFHYGEDIGRDAGTVLVAPDDCTVARLLTTPAVGNAVDLSMPGGLTVRMMHLASFGVVQGQALRRGDRVGTMGATGQAAGVHVHWEVRKDGVIQNPANYVTALTGGAETPLTPTIGDPMTLLFSYAGNTASAVGARIAVDPTTGNARYTSTWENAAIDNEVIAGRALVNPLADKEWEQLGASTRLLPTVPAATSPAISLAAIAVAVVDEQHRRLAS
jgi:hypothetical protein